MKSELIALSTAQFKKHWKKLLLGFILIGLVSSLGNVRISVKGGETELFQMLAAYWPAMALYGVVAFCVQSFATGAFTLLFLGTARDDIVPGVDVCFQQAFKKIKKLLMTNLLITLLLFCVSLPIIGLIIYLALSTGEDFFDTFLSISFGVSLLVLPFMIYFGSRLSFIWYLLIDENITAKQAIIRSWRITKGRVRFILEHITKFFLIIIFAIILSLVPVFIMFLISPLLMIPVFLIAVVSAIYASIIGRLLTANIYLAVKKATIGMAEEQPSA